MDFLLPLLSLLLLSIPIGMAAYAVSRAPSIMPGLFGWRSDGWPIGVQEEDDPRAWSQRASRAAARAIESQELPIEDLPSPENDASVPVGRVHGSVHPAPRG